MNLRERPTAGAAGEAGVHESLHKTEVTGQAASIAPLARLARLGLKGTAAAGCGAFCGEGGPFRASCERQLPTANGADGCSNNIFQGCYQATI